ncbi:MAG TPA: hypothetical protein VIG46_05790 [Candidatus Baltobacteraceae bacterium]
MKRLLVVLAVVVSITVSYAVAQANIRRIAVMNDSDTCAVVTVWEQVDNGPYATLGGHGPRQLKPRMDIDVPTTSGTKINVTAVRVRAEMKKNADCSGPTVSDLDQPEHSTRSGAEYSEAVLLGTKGAYRIKF